MIWEDDNVQQKTRTRCTGDGPVKGSSLECRHPVVREVKSFRRLCADSVRRRDKPVKMATCPDKVNYIELFEGKSPHIYQYSIPALRSWSTHVPGLRCGRHFPGRHVFLPTGCDGRDGGRR